MKALWFHPSIPRAAGAKILSPFTRSAYWSWFSPLVYGDMPVPERPSEEWVLVKSRLCGICGSDMAAITLKGSLDNPIQHFVSLPIFLGHEIVGEVAQPGDQVKDLAVGERVAVYPILSCIPRGISPVCRSCSNGDYSLCQNLAEGSLPPGQCIGTNSMTGGGFSEYLVAHRSQVFRIPDFMPDEQAVLLDPVCVALHAVLLAGLEASHTVLVFGAGIIGLSMIQIIRALNIGCELFAVARYDFQRELARECGADHVIKDVQDSESRARLAEQLNAKAFASRFVAPFFLGGFDVIFDCVGTARTLQNSIGLADHRGKVVLVGASPPERFEWSLLYWKELKVLGSISYGMETIEGKRRNAIEHVFQMVEDQRIRLDLLPVKGYRLSDYRTAFESLLKKGVSRHVKAAFDFR